MNRINRIDTRIQRVKILMSRKKKAGLNVTSQLEEIDGLQNCKKGNHYWVNSQFDEDEYCKKCFLPKQKIKTERV